MTRTACTTSRAVCVPDRTTSLWRLCDVIKTRSKKTTRRVCTIMYSNGWIDVDTVLQCGVRSINSFICEEFVPGTLCMQRMYMPSMAHPVLISSRLSHKWWHCARQSSVVARRRVTTHFIVSSYHLYSPYPHTLDRLAPAAALHQGHAAHHTRSKWHELCFVLISKYVLIRQEQKQLYESEKYTLRSGLNFGEFCMTLCIQY